MQWCGKGVVKKWRGDVVLMWCSNAVVLWLHDSVSDSVSLASGRLHGKPGMQQGRPRHGQRLSICPERCALHTGLYVGYTAVCGLHTGLYIIGLHLVEK